MTSRQRACLKGLTVNVDPVFQIDKSNLTSELAQAVDEALEARELIKVMVLKNYLDNGGSIVGVLAGCTHSQVVRVIGRRIILHRSTKEEKKRKIVLSEE